MIFILTTNLSAFISLSCCFCRRAERNFSDIFHRKFSFSFRQFKSTEAPRSLHYSKGEQKLKRRKDFSVDRPSFYFEFFFSVSLAKFSKRLCFVTFFELFFHWAVHRVIAFFRFQMVLRSQLNFQPFEVNLLFKLKLFFS